MKLPLPANCYLTDLPVVKAEHAPDGGVSYHVVLNGVQRRFDFSANVRQWLLGFRSHDQFPVLQQRLLAGEWWEDHMLEGGKITLDTLKAFLWGKDYPRTPQQKLDDLFLRIYECQHFEGQMMDISNADSPQFISLDSPYYLTFEELKFYLGVLIEAGYLDCEPGMDHLEFRRIHGFRPVPRFSISYKGLNRAIELTESGEHSDNAFVAMAFAPQYRSIYDRGIHPACIHTGFRPLRMDDEHLDSLQTINDSIIALIKRSQFLIADFTGGSAGVYTEAGIGIGRGMKVIYTCRDDWFDKIHFDLSNFPFIPYTDEEMLRRKLEDKINAWVKN
jgi:hypothetical protein